MLLLLFCLSLSDFDVATNHASRIRDPHSENVRPVANHLSVEASRMCAYTYPRYVVDVILCCVVLHDSIGS